MKLLVSLLLLAALLGTGCAGKGKAGKERTGKGKAGKEKAVFSAVPGPSPGINGNLPETPPPPAPAPPPKEKKRPSAKKPDLIVTPEKALNGKVATYNEVGRFVVVNFPGGRLPAAEQRMFVYRGGLKVGEVKINSWQRERYVVADLTAGEAQTGDEVREK